MQMNSNSSMTLQLSLAGGNGRGGPMESTGPVRLPRHLEVAASAALSSSREVWGELAGKWCHTFHRRDRKIVRVDVYRSVVECLRCGRKFRRYRVCWL